MKYKNMILFFGQFKHDTFSQDILSSSDFPVKGFIVLVQTTMWEDLCVDTIA